jgi:signal transduction histidine kinase/CheY-like chemotaxis protein
VPGVSTSLHANTVIDDHFANSAKLAEIVCDAFAATEGQVALITRAVSYSSGGGAPFGVGPISERPPSERPSSERLVVSARFGSEEQLTERVLAQRLGRERGVDRGGSAVASAVSTSAVSTSAVSTSALGTSGLGVGGGLPARAWWVLAASERLKAAWRGVDGTLELPAVVEKPLGKAFEACWVAGVRQTHELEVVPGLGAGPWRVEVAPWAACAGQQAAILLFSNDTELDALRRRIDQVNRSESLGLLAGSVAHDFNNLLTGIRGSLALVRHHVSPEGRANALAAADLAAQRAGEVTRRLLTFSRGPDHIQKRAEPLRVLQETVDLMRCIPDTSRVDTDIDAELGQVEMLPSELHQVVLNLLINASDAVRSLGGAAGVMLRASTTGRADAGGDRTSRRWLRVSVIDQGPGMDATLRQNIFEPFFTTKARGKGTGLGLCSVKDLVERVGGWLEVESELQRGSAFHVYLPLTAEAGESTPPPSQEVPRTRQRVLICDDEGRLADLTVGLLEEFGFSAQAVVRGEEALALLLGDAKYARPGTGAVGQRAMQRVQAGASESSEEPKVMLLDVNLAGGIPASQVLDELLLRGSSIKVILSSGLSQEDVPASLRNHRLVVSYLAKPYTVDNLVAAINAALG